MSSTGMERRNFLKVLGAGGAAATVAGCASEPERLIPYLVQPEEIVPGTSTWYRTTCRECPAGCGMTVRTREGRATKAEGNPLSPISHGRLCARGQASLHGLYDPDRIPQALIRQASGWGRVSWERAEQTLADALRQAGGRAVLLSRPEPGSMDRLLDEWCAALGVRRIAFEPFGHEAIRAAYRRLYGSDALPIHDFAQAEVVVSFGADFLETFLSPVDYAHDFAQGHAYDRGRRGTFVWVSPHQSLTGLNADTWLAARPGTEHLVALAMARLVADRTGRAGPAGALDGVDPRRLAETAGVDHDQVRLAADRFANGGRSLAVGPGVAATHAAATTLATAVAVLNDVAGNLGRTVRLGEPAQGRATHAEMADVVREMAAGEVSALLVRGANPLYELPYHEALEEALGRIPFIASFSPWLDETSEHAHLLLPDHHFLESWGDYEPRPGVHALIQPVMTPVFQTKQTGDVLLSVARRANAALPSAATTFYDYLREQWQGLQGEAGGAGGFDEWWVRALRDGVVVSAAATEAEAGLGGGGGVVDQTAAGPAATGTAAGAGAAGAQAQAGPTQAGPTQAGPAQAQAGGAGLRLEPVSLEGDGEYHLVVYPSYRFYDGRLANRPWLQELPDPVTKHTWGSVVEIHPDTADELDLDTGHIVEVRAPGGSVELPVYRHPGIRRDTIAIQLGQGHESYGRYAKGRGVNAVRLLRPELDPESGGLLWIQAMATVRPTGRWERQPFSSTQEDLSGRHLFESISLAEAIEADARPAEAHVAGAARAAEDPGAEGGGGLMGQGAGQEQEAHAPVGHGEPVDPMTARVRTLQESGGFAPVVVEAAPGQYPPPGTHYGEYSETQPRWGMAIDMDRCIGCSACEVACRAENNIGMVGPDLVAQGRIISWIRIERYYEEEHGEAEHEDGGATHRPVTFLPMLCQQCGNAPCEPVCPVYAAYHTPDGLNAQVYNRCVGTRYCANNCPYKVRYFNYFNYEWPEPLNWQLNPDVTVREKGIMEKCTFCVQRIRDAQHQARLAGRAVRDGEIVPACAQTCPSDVIVFGDIADPSSRVAQVASSGRSFRVFEELNTQSGIVYLKKVAEHATEGAGH